MEGDAWQRIIEQEQDCDLVVPGKHGQSDAEDLFLGSVTKSVLAEGSSDVLVSAARLWGECLASTLTLTLAWALALALALTA